MTNDGRAFFFKYRIMDVIGYLVSLLIGLTLGLIGSGGSILTVPVLVYLFQTNPLTATAYSLFIVGATSLVGAIPKYKHGMVHLPAALAFGLPSLGAVFFMRSYVVPHIPPGISLYNYTVSRGMLLMLVFAMLMILASLSMIRPPRNSHPIEVDRRLNPILIVLSGLIEGSLTGLVGAGGGFLIIPALVLLNKLPMKQAIGTSLLIIAAKSLIGFTGDLSHFTMDWRLLLSITALATLGIFMGNWLNTRIDGKGLRTGFGWFVMAMGVYIIIRELFLS